MRPGNANDPLVRMDLRLEDKSEWIKVFDPRDCTLFVPGDGPPPVGASARVDLAIGDSGPRIILRGRVISRRETPEGSSQPGCTLALSHVEREKINYLNGFVRGGLLDLRRRRRLPVRLPVTYRSGGEPTDSYTRDINEEGVFVISESPLVEDTEVQMDIHFPGLEQPITVTGVVSHTVVVEDEDVPGMGILFRLPDGQQGDFTALIDDLERRLLDGSLPEDCLL